ncbi:hypothetical protein RJT34_32097 [Clitoria ternatea]|uniref:AT hook motif-containing protein n=1 Tax=Clitoria ternatea TaxID=43366 RepID=A0AAN9I1Y8_CLITE
MYFLQKFLCLAFWKMNQQDQGSGQGSGHPSNVPVKRKRGRPRKEVSVAQSQGQSGNVPMMPGPDNALNSNQTAGTTDYGGHEMVGKVVTGVVEGTFNAGYLLNVKVDNTDTFLRGVVFRPSQVTPVTAENDVAPHARMIERKEIPIPVHNPQAEMQGSVPSSVQCSKQSFEPQSQRSMSEEQVQPTDVHPGISVSFDNQLSLSGSRFVSVSESPFPLNISTGGLPQGTSEPQNMNQSSSAISEFEHDKTVKQGETSTQVQEPGADGGAKTDMEAAPELMDIVPTIQNTDNELRSEQQTVPSMHQLNEVMHDEPNTSNIEVNLISESAEPEAMQSEQTSKSVDNFAENHDLPKSDVQEDTGTNLDMGSLSKVDMLNSDGRASSDVANIPDVRSEHALNTSQPESVPSESKFSSEGCGDFREKSDVQKCSSSDGVTMIDFSQPTESLAKSLDSEKQIGSGTS